MTSHPKEPKLPESLGASFTHGMPSVEDCTVALVRALQDEKGWLHDYADAIVRDAIERKHLERSDAESALKARDAEIERVRGDAERLDWLDGLNRALNKQNGTTYQWKLVLSPNVVRLMAGRHDNGCIGDIDLHDSDARGVSSCRAAIDQARATGGEKANG